MGEQANATTRGCDVVVLGLGPGGESVATKLAGAGLDVVGIDRRLVGGECPYYGCVPSKMMLRAADALAEGRRIPGLAGGSEVRPGYTPVHERIRDEATTDWDDQIAVDRLEDAGVTFVRAHGRLAGPGRVRVDATGTGASEYAARRGVVLNTGTEPAVPPIDGLAGTPYWTNREALRLESLPASLLVLGGGPIGAELAQAFARFDVEVTLVEMADRLIANEEPEAGDLLGQALARDGIQVRTGAEATGVRHADGTFTLTLADEELTADKLLVATGRHSNLDDIGLDTLGLDPSLRSIEVDERMRVTDGIWAIGDITGHGQFTHMSMYQADLAARDILGGDGPWADYRAASHVTFTDPEVGVVGMTEQQARDAGLDVATGRSDLGARGWIAGAEGMIKVVADRDRDVLVGATCVGPSGGEIVGLLATAVHARVPIPVLRGMHFAYPTYHRAIETALEGLAG